VRLPDDRVEVRGTATRALAADHAQWALVVTESGDRPAAVFARCGERLDALTRGLRDALGEAADVRTGAVRVAPQRDERGRPLARVDATGEVTVRVRLADAGRAAGAAMDAGADHLRGPSLEVAGQPQIEEELTGAAVAAARRKAEHVAAAAGRTLGRVVSVAEAEEGHRPIVRAALASSGGYEGPELSPGDADVAVSVRVVFALD